MKTTIDFKKLKQTLDAFSAQFDYGARIINDPIRFVRRFQKPADAEVAGLISSAFAYGSVNLIIKTLESIFSKIGESPSKFVDEWDLKKERLAVKLFGDFYYRFNNADDLSTLLWAAGEARRKWGSLNNLFLEGYNTKAHSGKNGAGLRIAPAMHLFSKKFLEIARMSPYPNQKNFEYFFPSPLKNSPCKRMCLFLRWMNREDDVDPGGWKGVKGSDLVVPVDTHLARIGRYLGFTVRKNASWKMAVEITESLKKLDPEDPLKYDFLICHIGISGQCPQKYNPRVCKNCRIKEFCLKIT